MNGPAISSSWSAAQRREVLAQLAALVASPLFRQSKRYPAFLRYVVETTLDGAEEELKERTIGVEVFGRLAHYDTSLDPTVRLTAAEVRKRLAQYYQQGEHAAELQIALNPGSYVPSFGWPARAAEAGLPESAAVTLPEAVEAGEPQKRGWWLAGVAVAVVLVLAGISVSRVLSARASAHAVWGPLLRDPNSVSFVLPDLAKTAFLPQAAETGTTSLLAHIRDNRVVDFNDSVALARLSGLLGKWNKPTRVLLSSDATFGDLQAGPAVLIGALDNPWTMRLLEPLPYSVARRGATMTFAIVGRNESAEPDWSIDLTQPFGKVQQDFGIVARLTDTMTGRPVLIVAGLGQNGTAAGVRLLTDSALEGRITKAAPKGWSGRNVEVIFRTQIIDDEFGPPEIVARKYW